MPERIGSNPRNLKIAWEFLLVSNFVSLGANEFKT
jgi:hypothetical protein